MTFCFAVSMAFISLGYTITVVRSAVYIMGALRFALGVLLPLIRSRLSAPGFTFSAAFLPGIGAHLWRGYTFPSLSHERGRGCAVVALRVPFLRSFARSALVVRLCQ